MTHTYHCTVGHALGNDCELVIVSQFPITKNYDKEILSEDQFYAEDHLGNTPAIYDNIVTLGWDITVPNSQYIVVGKLPYTLESIIRQILVGLKRMSCDNVLFMEHDCLYPVDYICAADKAFGLRDFTYVSFMHRILSYEGYWDLKQPAFVLGASGGNRKLMIEVFENKLKLIREGKPFRFEPMLIIEPAIKLNQYPDEIYIESSICMDTFLEENHKVIDMKHGLNQNGYLNADADRAEMTDPHFGDAGNYIAMMGGFNNDEGASWRFGIDRF